MVTWLFKNFCL